MKLNRLVKGLVHTEPLTFRELMIALYTTGVDTEFGERDGIKCLTVHDPVVGFAYPPLTLEPDYYDDRTKIDLIKILDY